MKKRVFVLSIIFFVVTIFYAHSIFANDMELEVEEGITLLLHEDNTWDYQSSTSPELKEDVSIILNNGNTVRITTNQSWFFIEGGSSTPEEKKYLGSAFSVGTAQGPDLFNAKTTAIKKATWQLAEQLLSAAAGPYELTTDKLSECIEKEDKEIKIQEKLQKDIWKVQVNMSLDKDQIEYIIDCATGLTE